MGTQSSRAVSRSARPLLLLVAAITISIATLLGSTSLTRAAGQPLRQVDWRGVLKSDPAVTLDPTAYPLPGGNLPYINVKASPAPDDVLGGYAMVDDVLYGDLDGDGADEAVILVASGGTAGILGFLLYREGTLAPKLVLVKMGYKLSAQIDGGKLVVYEPHYVGFEPNCCPSAGIRTVNALEGDRLVTLLSEVEPNDAQELTVSAFYAAVSNRQYDVAYEFYSPAFQARNPFDQWKAGYANTQSIEVETSPGATPGEVQILLTAVDRRPGGGTVTQRFKGTWTLVWSAEQMRWLLDRASIQQA